VIVPLPFAPLVGIALGVALAWVARGALAREEGPLVASRAFLHVALFAMLVFTPIVGYFTAFHADWAYVYLVPPRAIPSAVDLALVLLAGATVPVGFAVSARAARAQRLGTVALIGGVPATILAVLLIVWQRRLATSATYAQFHGDFGTQAITQATLGRGILWMAFVAALGIAWCGWNIRESS
jgi:hypothetical protein